MFRFNHTSNRTNFTQVMSSNKTQALPVTIFQAGNCSLHTAKYNTNTLKSFTNQFKNTLKKFSNVHKVKVTVKYSEYIRVVNLSDKKEILISSGFNDCKSKGNCPDIFKLSDRTFTVDNKSFEGLETELLGIGYGDLYVSMCPA